MKITENHETKIAKLVSEGQTSFEATAMYPNFSEADAYQLFQSDVKAIRKLADDGEFTIKKESPESRTGNHYIKLVMIEPNS